MCANSRAPRRRRVDARAPRQARGIAEGRPAQRRRGSPGPACYGKGGTEPTVTDANVVLGRVGRSSPAPPGGVAGATWIAGSVALEDFITCDMGGTSTDVCLIESGRPATSTESAFMGYPERARVAVADLATRRSGSTRSADVAISPWPRASRASYAWWWRRWPTRSARYRSSAATIRRASPSSRSAAPARCTRPGSRPSSACGGCSCRSIPATCRPSVRAPGLRAHRRSRRRAERARRRTPPRSSNAYARQYGHAHASGDIEIVNLRTTVIGVTPKPRVRRLRHGGKMADATLPPRDMVVEGKSIPVSVYERERLPVDVEFEGPAVIEEAGATTVMLPRWRGRRDDLGNLRFEAVG